MSIVLPDFKGRNCIDFSCCGFISAEKAASVKKDLRVQKKTMTAKYRKSGKDVYVRLYLPFPWEKKTGGRGHVHLVLAPEELFAAAPTTNCDPHEIISLLEPFLGQEMDAHLVGEFRVPRTELPAFIGLSIAETVANEIQVRVTGGTLSVRGAPIQEISWKLPEKGGAALVYLDARTRFKLERLYLETGLNLLESAFKAIIVGERSDG